MATYAIGDIQGCMQTLDMLLGRIDFSPQKDHLIVVGDLVNRGPESLATLRWAKTHEQCVTLVLGNHDLALLAVAHGVRPRRPKDTFQDILEAEDSAALLQWLRARPMAHVQSDKLFVHAGVLPQWTVQETLAHAQQAEQTLRGDDAAPFLAALEMRAHTPAHLAPAVHAARVLTYLRAVDAHGQPDYSFKGPPSALPRGHMPWFAAPHRQTQNTTIVCGHWAALGLHTKHNVRALDTGCVWGNVLTALRLDDDAVVQVPYGESVPAAQTLSD